MSVTKGIAPINEEEEESVNLSSNRSLTSPSRDGKKPSSSDS